MATTPEPSLSEAIAMMEAQLAEFRTQPRGDLHDLDSDTAFEKGYEVALFDLKRLTRSTNPQGA